MASSLSTTAAGGLYRHVVLFKFKDSASQEDVRKIEKAFSALKSKVDLIQDYEWGKNVSPEGLNQGFTHCFFVTFKNKEDLEKYLPHPEHKAFVALLKPVIDGVCVIDYIASSK